MADAEREGAQDWSAADVLLVDDDDYFRSLMQRQLRELGITRIREAADGAGALYHLNYPDHPALVICDLQMPTMNGAEFLRELYLEDFRGSVLLVSGEDPLALRAAAQLALAFSLNLLAALSKPVSSEALSQALSRPLPGPPRAPQGETESATVSVGADELREALSSDEFTLHYQPKVALPEGRIVGFEALARWTRAGGSEIRPERLLELAVKHELTDWLTRHVLQTALTQLAALLTLHEDWTLAVNLFARDLLNPDLPGHLAALADAVGCRPRQLILEVSGLPPGARPEKLLEVASQLSLRGVGLALDGPGIGYMELERLLQLPFCEFKLDRNFVRGAQRRPHAAAILQTQALQARRLGLRVVAEGVESRADWDFVALSGCDQAQGYFIAPAMPADALRYWAAWYADKGQALCADRTDGV